MGLLAPAAIFFGALLAPVIAMYFIRQRREHVVLPTVALWMRFVQDRAQAARLQRFRSDPLLWLQLALMIALILALARPFRQGGRAPGQATVVVLDASASMQTVEDGQTRFAAAKAEIETAARALGGGDQMMLVAAGPRPWVVQGLTGDGVAFRRALRDLACTDGAGDLAAALRVAAQAAGPGAPPYIRVWTDAAGAMFDRARDAGVPAEWNLVGTTDDNVAVTALAVRRRPDSPLDLEVFASVANLSSRPHDAEVSLRLNDALLAFGRRRLAPGATAIVTEPLLAGRSGIVHMEVKADDALATDNSARLVLSAGRAVRVLLITSGNPVLERVLRLLPGTEVTVAAPGWHGFERAAADLVVLDGWVPPQWPQVPVLAIGPPAGATLPGAVLQARPMVSSWRHDHPLLRHLTFADVHVVRSLVQPRGRGITPLVSAQEGGLVWSQHQGGDRQIVVGFALADTDWILRPSFPLFLANVLESVRDTGGGGDGGAARVGESVRVLAPLSASNVSVRYPDGAVRPAPLRDGYLLVDDTWQAGVYAFEADGWSAERAVNLLDEDESRIAPGTAPDSTAPAVARAGVGITREYWPWMVVLAFLLSLIEWHVFHRRTL